MFCVELACVSALTLYGQERGRRLPIIAAGLQVILLFLNEDYHARHESLFHMTIFQRLNTKAHKSHKE